MKLGKCPVVAAGSSVNKAFLRACVFQAQLSKTGQVVMGIEKSALEIATLNQLFSAAISSQAAAIEEIYDNAVAASFFVRCIYTGLECSIAVQIKMREGWENRPPPVVRPDPSFLAGLAMNSWGKLSPSTALAESIFWCC